MNCTLVVHYGTERRKKGTSFTIFYSQSIKSTLLILCILDEYILPSLLVMYMYYSNILNMVLNCGCGHGCGYVVFTAFAGNSGRNCGLDAVAECNLKP